MAEAPLAADEREHELVEAMRGAVLVERGTGWVKIHGLPDPQPLFELLNAAKDHSAR